MILQNLGHVILVIAATVIGFVLYDNVTGARKKEYLDSHELTAHQRKELEKEGWHDRLIVIVRLAIYALSAVFALGGDALGIILVILFTFDGLAYVYKEAFTASKSRAAALTFLTIPFGALVMAFSMKFVGIIGGILLGILTIMLVQIVRLVSLQLLNKEEE